uniref:SKP1-interacting partner 15 n=1 Tax=Erigeron canadensis TaxID=72917 RepID=UPI001CB8D1C5|nr:SKP1-interacting partner 15 [Erigeron canadensis]
MENIFSNLPQDIIHQIFTRLPLRQVLICRSVARNLHTLLSSNSFTTLFSATSPFPLLALRPPHRHNSLFPSPSLHLFDPSSDNNNIWLHFSLSFLPFPSPHPIASSNGILYLWADSPFSDCNKVLIACNPLTRIHKVLPQLGSAWSRHGSVLVDSGCNRVIVLNELAALCYSGGTDSWLKFSSNLPSKPRSPIIIGDSVLALCDVGTPWRSQWKLFICGLNNLKSSQQWVTLEKPEWRDVFDILKRPRLLKGLGNVVLMIGGLKSSFSLNASCSTILILKLDLSSFEWGEAGRMPLEMFKCFQESSKFKVFGGGSRVCFSAKRIGRLALWESNEISGNGKEEWKWIDGVPGNGDGLYRGFLFDARLDSSP